MLHVDRNEYYGSEAASLTVKELTEWSSTRSPNDPHHSISCRLASSESPHAPPSLLDNSRQYSISLSPSLVTSSGILVDHLVQSGVSKYGGFQLLEAVGVVQHKPNSSGSRLRIVPLSKEDIFTDPGLSLLSKRKLMKLLQFAMGPYEDSEIWQGTSHPIAKLSKSNMVDRQGRSNHRTIP